MDQQTLALRDIHLPDAVGWWPPAPGWWLLFGLLLAALAVALWQWRRWRAAWARRLAQAEFDQLRARFAADGDAAALAAASATLLRRTCLTFFPRAHVASLTGQRWLEFLDAAADGWQRKAQAPAARFASPAGVAWLSAAYRPQADLDGDALIALCEDWLAGLPREHYPDQRDPQP